MTPIYYQRVCSSRTSTPACARSTSAIRIIRSEIAYYIPASPTNTDKRCIKLERQRALQDAIQTNNVEVDDRGYIYGPSTAPIRGSVILELTGAPAHSGKIPRPRRRRA
jgi:hypothetical protein